MEKHSFWGNLRGGLLILHNRWVRLAAGAGAIYLGMRFLLVPLLPFLIALTVAVVLEPWVLWCQRRLSFRRKFAAAALTTVLLGAVLGGLGWLLVRLVREAIGWLENLPRALEALPALMDEISVRYEGFYEACPAEIRQWLDSFLRQVSAEGVSLVGDLSGTVIGWASSVVSALPQISLFLFTTVLAMYFVTTGYPEILTFIRAQIPASWQETGRGITRSLRSTFWKWLKAESFLCFVTFLLLLLGFWYMGLEYALLGAVLVAIVDALPVLGTGTVLVPWGLWHLLLGSAPRGVALLALYAIISAVRSLIEPKVMAAQAGLHPLTALLSMYLGFSLFGVGGMILLPIVLLFLKQLQDGGFLHIWR